MAWVEQLASGKYRGGYRDSARRKQYVVQADGTGFDRKTDAKEAAQEKEVDARRIAAIETGEQSAKITWGDWWRAIEGKHLKGVASDTKEKEQWIVSKYLMPQWETVPLNQITRRRVQNWVKDDITPGHKPTYIRKVYAPFRWSINRAVDEEILKASPCAGIKLPSAKKQVAKVHTTTGDRDKLLPHLNVAYQRMLEFQLDTGLRPGELCGMHADQVDFDTGWIKVSNVYVPKLGRIRPWPKNEKQRQVPATKAALAAAKAAIGERPLRAGCGVPHSDGSKCRSIIVFLSPTDKPVLPLTFRAALNRAADKAEMPFRGPYANRRGFGTRAAAVGTDAFTIAAWMGHSDLEETDGYVQRTDAARAKFVAALGEREPLRAVGQGVARGAEPGAEVPGHPLESPGVEEAGHTG